MTYLVLGLVIAGAAYAAVKLEGTPWMTVPSTGIWLAVFPGIPIAIFVALGIWLIGWPETLIYLTLVVAIPLIVWRLNPAAMKRAVSGASATRPETPDERE